MKRQEAERRQLSEEVLRLHRLGVGEETARAAREEGEEPDENDLRQAADRRVTPGAPVPLPSTWPAAGQAAERGGKTYTAIGCVKCHGRSGRGAPDLALSCDEWGDPVRARDLVHEAFKGGREPESVGRRILAGMPGSPHPAAATLDPAQLVDLVSHCLSLAQNPEKQMTNHERAVLAEARDYLVAIGDSGP